MSNFSEIFIFFKICLPLKLCRRKKATLGKGFLRQAVE